MNMKKSRAKNNKMLPRRCLGWIISVRECGTSFSTTERGNYVEVVYFYFPILGSRAIE